MPEEKLALRHTTLVQALHAAAKTTNGLTFLSRGEPEKVSYQELYASAANVSLKLQVSDVKPGDIIILILPTGPDLVIHFFACILLGAVPCIQASPRAHGSLEGGIEKICSVLDLLEPRLLVTTASEKDRWGDQLSRVEVRVPFLADNDSYPLNSYEAQAAQSDVVLVQATSGSTSLPKCIALTHFNVCSNCQQVKNHWDMSDNDRVVGWLPMFHDLGLLGQLLIPVYTAIDCVLMNPSTFLRRPKVWLSAISDYRGTMSPAPNFAFAMVASRVKKEEIIHLDLSCWRAAVCGAERINPQSLRNFYSLTKEVDFKKTSFVPAYGLAEATVCVTADKANVETMVDDPESTDSLMQLTKKKSDDQISSSGSVVPGTSVYILSDDGNELPEGESGRICIKGPSIMKGYIQPDGTYHLPLESGLLDTGDIGYMKQGLLFVAGRAKELIIIRGENYFPTDFEFATNEVAGCESSRVVALGIVDGTGQSEEVHLILEMSKMDKIDESKLKEAVSRHVAHRTGIMPARIEFVPKRTLPLTTSGKLQRNAFLKTYNDTRAEELEAIV